MKAEKSPFSNPFSQFVKKYSLSKTLRFELKPHPGTVDSPLSKPFQKSIAKEKLFTAEDSSKKLLAVLESLKTNDSGKCFAWDGQEIPP